MNILVDKIYTKDIKRFLLYQAKTYKNPNKKIDFEISLNFKVDYFSPPAQHSDLGSITIYHPFYIQVHRLDETFHYM